MIVPVQQRFRKRLGGHWSARAGLSFRSAAPRRAAGRPALLPVLLLAALLLPGLLPAGDAQAQELRIWRNIFAAQREAAGGDAASLTAKPAPLNTPLTLEDQVLSVAGLQALRIKATRPQASAVLRFSPIDPTAPEGPQRALRLRLILINRPGRETYQIERDSEILRDGALHPRRAFALGTRGTLTELQGAPGRVTELEIQDDGLAELRLHREGSTLLLSLVAPEDGGTPSGSRLPFWQGQTLAFADYHLLGAGHTTHGAGELWLGRMVAGRIDGFVDGKDNVVLGRVVFTHEFMRGRYWSVWLDGGLGAWQETKNSETTQDSTELTWTFGSTGVFRWYDWGTALHLATVNGPVLTQVWAAWQFAEDWAAVLTWHSFEGFSGNGAGLGVQF